MKKVIIIEGVDNCGKDTLIKKLHEYFNGSVELHAGIPDTGISLFDFYYNGLIHSTLDHYYHTDVDAIIHNRSMYGEFVYGPKYRGKTPSEVADMIYRLETGQLRTFILSNELHFILLTSSDVSLLVNNDDGKSISNKEDDIRDEINSFDTIFNLSNIENKLRVYVNNGNNFRSKDDIYSDVIKFISNT